MSRGLFVTGTDTGVGKTLVSCALLHALRARGIDAVPMKPVAAGVGPGRAMNEDTQRLLQAAGVEGLAAEQVTPVLLRAAMAPHAAAAREGRTIALDDILPAFRALGRGDRFVVAEGVGGFRVPLSPTLDSVDLARALALPVVMVVGVRLGCINHGLLTAAAIDAAGLRFAGWIANRVDPAMEGPDESIAALRERLRAPLLGDMPFAPRASPATMALHLRIAKGSDP